MPPTSSSGSEPAYRQVGGGRNGVALTAAAQLLSGPKVQRLPRYRGARGFAWQQEAWAYFDEVGELSWGVEAQALAVSKVALVAAREGQSADQPEFLSSEPPVDPEEPVDPVEQAAAELVRDFAGGTSGRQQLLYRVAVQLQVAAESYIFGRQTNVDEEIWEAYSNEEVRHANTGYTIDDGTQKFATTPDDILIRCWRAHPRRRNEPRSPLRALLPVLHEIRGLQAHVSAQIDSRLAGAGILILPKSMTFASNQAVDAKPNEDVFVASLMDAMITSLKDRDSAAAIVPIVIQVPDESIANIKHLTFASPLDAAIRELREESITRLARGMDMPPEVLMGLGSTNHWSAWAIDEDAITGPITSLAATICHALTIGWLRPALRELFGDNVDVSDIMVWFDPTPLIVRPDRSGQAIQVFDRGGLSLSALVRESGFAEADMPTEDEFCRQLLIALVKARPDMATVLLERLGICAGIATIGELAELMPGGQVVQGEVPDDDDADDAQPEGRRLPAREDVPPPNDGGPPPTVASAAAPPIEPLIEPCGACAECAEGCSDQAECLLVACDIAVHRALEIAAKRVLTRTTRRQFMDVPAHMLYTHVTFTDENIDKSMEGAWDSLMVAMPGHEKLVAALDDYVRDLLKTGEPHKTEWLRPILQKWT